ncbi:class I SAM-dependent methyltransferase [Microvirga guangxiensis]|uniref:SAM-dependent methyltransferase, MidA family n=1 Tax=Microvirga guangxiensis TaxID=549386 RepID=A0A1G5L8A3_9HYPH|nr:SAM-dependent methyltransferase [Microvirga guangxiensis]SCZ09115.1 SAM-dependent methyltransferase, MidA family [Microvirga guangxiensis]
MTALDRHVRELIAFEGPITVERYMGLCLQHYYATRDPLGAGGDFTTAPEISQMFGELIGLWMLEVWNSMGRPAPVHLVELGPGRGTLMADLLRATKLLPDFANAVQVHLVETSPVLKQKQQATLASSGLPVQWHERLEDVPEGSLLLVANEFFDALPVRQFIATERGWCERLVGLEGESLIFGLRAEAEQALGQILRIGDVLEWPAMSIDIMQELSRRIAQNMGAALIIDYGYWGPAFGDTLQALKKHLYVDPLTQSGEADLTTHVDFHRLAQAAAAQGLQAHGPASQGDFLTALGIEARATSLKKRATHAQSADIDAALARLTERGEKGMGELFKVLAVTHNGLEAVPGLLPLSSS